MRFFAGQSNRFPKKMGAFWIFKTDSKTLAEACHKTDWQIHAYCLMCNHYHLVLETPNANLVAGMAWLQSTYTIRLNHRHKLVGHVFSGRYKAQLVEGSGNGYLKTACDYVHLNPVRAGLLRSGERLLASQRGQSIEKFGLGLILAAAFRSLWLDATQDASPISWGDVSRHEPGRPARGYFPE